MRCNSSQACFTLFLIIKEENMGNPIPVIPTLHNQSAKILTNIEDIAAYTIRWFFANPGETSTPIEDELISFRKFNALNGNTPDGLCDKIRATLLAILTRYSDDISVDCSFVNSPKKDDSGHLVGTYEIDIAVTTRDGSPIIPTSHIILGDNNKTIDIRFGGIGVSS
jgi:hypothetical protein